jgi:RHS repeat-associated protein
VEKKTTVYEYTWNALNQLAGAIKKENGLHTLTMAYAYDASGGRVIREKSDVLGAQLTNIRQDLYLGGYERRGVQLVDESGTPRSILSSIWDTGEPGRYTDIAGSKKLKYVAGLRVERTKDGSTGQFGPEELYLSFNNHLGSTSAVIDFETGALVEWRSAYAYGADEVHWKNGDEKYATAEEPYKFTGKEEDEAVGLFYFGARYYSAGLGRWLNPDPPVVHGGGFGNHYMYGMNSPYIYVDPDGNDAMSEFYSQMSSGIAESYSQISAAIGNAFGGALASALGQFMQGIGSYSVSMNAFQQAAVNIATIVNSSNVFDVINDVKGWVNRDIQKLQAEVSNGLARMGASESQSRDAGAETATTKMPIPSVDTLGNKSSKSTSLDSREEKHSRYGRNGQGGTTTGWVCSDPGLTKDNRGEVSACLYVGPQDFDAREGYSGPGSAPNNSELLDGYSSWELLLDLGNFLTGVADVLSFGIGPYIRNSSVGDFYGARNGVDIDSNAYEAGRWVGIGGQIAMGGASFAKVKGLGVVSARQFIWSANGLKYRAMLFRMTVYPAFTTSYSASDNIYQAILKEPIQIDWAGILGLGAL